MGRILTVAAAVAVAGTDARGNEKKRRNDASDRSMTDHLLAQASS